MAQQYARGRRGTAPGSAASFMPDGACAPHPPCLRMTHTSHGAPESWPGSWRARLANLHPRVYLGLHVLAGTIGIVGLTWLFLAIADEIPERSRLVRVDAVLA